MIYREDWVLNIFIQYLVLMDTYKRHSTISYKQLTREFTRNRGGPKWCIAKRSKINPNINQLIKSTCKVFNHRLFMASPFGRVLKGCLATLQYLPFEILCPLDDIFLSFRVNFQSTRCNSFSLIWLILLYWLRHRYVKHIINHCHRFLLVLIYVCCISFIYLI